MATSAQVEQSIRRLLNKCGATLLSKGKDYSGEDYDRLKNFKDAAEIESMHTHSKDQKVVLWGYLLKHIASIKFMCHMTKGLPSRKQWDEKLGDAINYLLLLSAMVDEEIAFEKECGERDRFPVEAWAVTKHSRTKAETKLMEGTK